MRFNYPQELPVSAARNEIEQAVRKSQVVIVSGQTGSGKTTQIPKILLQMGRGTHGHQIVHTQPRRIAARTVAERIAGELGVHLGGEVGFQVRFTDESSPQTRLRVVTDGILLAQIQRDPKLTAYDTIVIDEAHERSLNIDFLLGYLTALLPQRRELKLVITSATIDSQKFQKHFSKALHAKVPIIEVSGRTYPVQIVYEPLDSPPALMNHVDGFAGNHRMSGLAGPRSSSDDDDALDVPDGVARACTELVTISSHDQGARDILVFASGERDIHEFETALNRHFGPRTSDMRRPDAIEILPLFARLSSKDQHRVFEHHQHQRIVIATNVAETSLTVPGIRYVVDPGTARISRYSKSAKVQRLPIEDISQASADQRSGRCGRIADGIAIRLYSSEDYETRPKFTEPEILRTSLGAVVLHMLSVGVAKTAGDVTDFGFIDPPDMRAVSDGFNELTELKAIAPNKGSHAEVRLTAVGRRLARIPIDIRLGRMVVEAAGNTPNTLAAVLVIVAFLSLQDPRERPQDKREESDRIHNRYVDRSSDFLTALNIWDRFFQADGDPGNGTLRRLCKSEMMSYVRMRQWRDLFRQLAQMCHELKFKVGEPLPSSRPELAVRELEMGRQAAHSLICSWDDEGIHRSMLAGLLSNMGMQVIREPKASDFAGLSGAARARAMKRAQKMSHNEYQGARNTHFALFPASGVAKTPPPWVMVTGLVETSRLWARYAANINPEWAESLAGPLTRTTYAEPHWAASHGSAIASAKVLLYGLPIVQGKTVQWGSINPVEARDFLIRQGLVEGDIQQRFPYDRFIEVNRSILAQADDESSRTRNIGESVSDEDLHDFYDRVLPDDITSVAALGSWWKHEHQQHPHLLDFDPDSIERLQDSTAQDLADYPDHWSGIASDGSPYTLRLSYVYNPQAKDDGVSVHVPVKLLARLSPQEFTWNVPGFLDDVILSTIKSLPKALRVQFVPAPDTAQSIRRWIGLHYPQLPGVDASPDDLASGAALSSASGTASAASPHAEMPRESSESPSLGGTSQWPEFTQAFTEAAIEISDAQIHPGIFNDEQRGRMPDYTRMTFVVEAPAGDNEGGKGAGADSGSVDNRSRSHHSHHRRKRGIRVLGSGKSLTELQHRFADESKAAARRQVGRRAAEAASKGKPVEQSKLLHQAGATTISHREMLWDAAFEALRMPPERISSRWLGEEALMLAATPYPSTKALTRDLQYAAVKRLLPRIDGVSSDQTLAQSIDDVREVYEDTVYAVAHDVIRIMKRYAQLDAAISGPADLPLLAVLQSIREHMSGLVHPAFLHDTPGEELPHIERFLHADIIRLDKAKKDKSRDVRWAWQADEARQLVVAAQKSAAGEPAGARRDRLMTDAELSRWLLEEFFVSLWAQELGTAQAVSLQRIRKQLQA
ncbi:ATP-dependent RNA helicase HrpA [Bifidobacterium sp.]|uniref:ATP-dependent RNA helicase HrpA n=1 Tax=Bifidobacterium sp. TaxID=41200 RepID=UPI0039E857CD